MDRWSVCRVAEGPGSPAVPTILHLCDGSVSQAKIFLLQIAVKVRTCSMTQWMHQQRTVLLLWLVMFSVLVGRQSYQGAGRTYKYIGPTRLPQCLRLITRITFSPSHWGHPRPLSEKLPRISLSSSVTQENAYDFSNVIIIFLLNSQFSKQCALH